MTAHEIIRTAHAHSGATITELAERAGIGAARLGEWLSRAKPNAKPREVLYKPPSDADVRKVVTACVDFARAHLQAVSILRDELPRG